MTERYHCELAWLGGDRAEAGVVIGVDGDTIISVEIGGPAAGATRLSGLTVPGLANTHSHAFHRALRSRTQTGTSSFWAWREQMYGLAATLTPDTYYALARATYAEMVLAGITAVGEFHYLHHGPGGVPYADPNEMGRALIRAAADAGIRITLLDTCYLAGGIGVELNDTQRRFSDGDALSWAARASELGSLRDPTTTIGAAIHSVRAVEPAAMEIVAAWAEAGGTPLHAHVSEQPAENEQCRAAYRASPIGLLGDRGVLSDRFTAVHATHLDDADVAAAGDAAIGVCLCPTTERDLADGIGAARALRDAGCRISLGSDSHAVIDMFEEARAVELDERLATGVRGHHDAASLLGAATVHGHASLGRPFAGVLSPGAPADLVSIRLDSVRTAGATADHALEAAVFAATSADVHHVVVGGRVVVSGGHHSTIDVARELGQALARCR